MKLRPFLCSLPSLRMSKRCSKQNSLCHTYPFCWLLTSWAVIKTYQWHSMKYRMVFFGILVLAYYNSPKSMGRISSRTYPNQPGYLKWNLRMCSPLMSPDSPLPRPPRPLKLPFLKRGRVFSSWWHILSWHHPFLVGERDCYLAKPPSECVCVCVTGYEWGVLEFLEHRWWFESSLISILNCGAVIWARCFSLCFLLLGVDLTGI